MSDVRPQVGQEQPDSPGLWEREGKFWRVWHDGHYDRIQHINAHNGFVGDHNYLDHENTPTGNWRKITAPPRPTFQAPPRPELVLFRPISNGEPRPARYGLRYDKTIDQPCGENNIVWKVEDIELLNEEREVVR